MSTAAATDVKAGYCSNCRRGDHPLCVAPGCACKGPGLRHPMRAKSSDGSTDELGRRPLAGDRTPPATPTPVEKPKRKVEGPTFELRKADPPATVRTVPLVDRVTPLLDQIPTDDGDWWQIATYKAQGSAQSAAGHLRKHVTAWEFTARLGVIYARRAKP